MKNNKITKYIVIAIIVLLFVALIFILIDKRQSISSNKTTEGNKSNITLSNARRGSLILWTTKDKYDGNLGGRQGADRICQKEMPKVLNCSNLHAFISVTENDSIKNMPDNYKYAKNRAIYWYNVKNNNLVLTADNWSDLIDGSIKVSPDEGTGEQTNYWVGSHPDGSLNNNKNCRNWTGNGPTMSGSEGRGATKDARWLGIGSLDCDAQDNILCVCQK